MTDAADNGGLVHLTDGHCSLLLSSDGGMPQLVHWGAPLGDVDERVLGAVERPVPRGGLDVDPPLGLVAEASVGWFGTPGVEGHRADGGDFAPQFRVDSTESTPTSARFELTDASASLGMSIALTLHPSGVATFAVSVVNNGASAYALEALRVSLPLPSQAAELLTVGGRWTNEFLQTRTPWNANCLTIENRRGHTSHERVGAVFAGTGETIARPATETILVVEDDMHVRVSTTDALRELGYTVVHAGSAEEALHKLGENPGIALLFTDIVMPVMNGRKLAEVAVKRIPGLKVIFTTGFTKNAVVHNGILDHDVHFLAKPFTIEQLAAKLRDVLDAKA